MKTWLIISGKILGVSILIFLGVNYYENVNFCEFQIIDTMPFIVCPLTDSYSSGKLEKYKPDIRHILLKPLILLYPESDTQVDVKLKYAPGFSATFPEYQGESQGWSVLAHPDGTLLDSGTNQESYGLFWEGNPSPIEYDISHGFVVGGSDIREFLYRTLTDIGLNTKEKSDFIMYWYPKLQAYPYVQLTFAGKDYVDIAKLDITPTPNSLLRVFMVAKPLRKYRVIPEQKLEKFERKGFSVVEWGGTIVE